MKHRYPQGCQNIDWKEANPEWETKTCAPSFSCLENPGADLTNASFISVQEQPYQNAPEVNPPIFPLDKDYLKTIVFSDNTTVADTPSLCQYTCNDGYKFSTGPCVTGAAATATVTGTTIPATTLLKATITNGGTGYTTVPTVTLSNACPTTVTATATVAS